MVDAEKNPDLEPGWHGSANGVADLASIEVHEVDAARCEARFDIADISAEMVFENSLGAGVVALGAGEKIPRVTQKLPLEMRERIKAKIRCPRGGRRRVFVRPQFAEEVPRQSALDVEVGFGFRERVDEVAERWGHGFSEARLRSISSKASAALWAVPMAPAMRAFRQAAA